jgi:hypothetical protein
MFKGRNFFENHINEMSKELSFVLVVLISLSQFLRELLICSLLLQTILPPHFCVVMYARRGPTVSLFVFDFGKRYHLLIQDLG